MLFRSKEKDTFAADYRVLNRAWDALSPDIFLNAYKSDYQWLSRVYESVKPTDGRGGLIWASLGAKTIELVHQNVTVGETDEDMDILAMDADLIDDFLEKQKDLKKAAKKVEISLVAKILNHAQDPKFIRLGEKLEALREKHEQGLVTSIEFLKLLLTTNPLSKRPPPCDYHMLCGYCVRAMMMLFSAEGEKDWLCWSLLPPVPVEG